MGQTERRAVVGNNKLSAAATGKEAVIVPHNILIDKAGLGSGSNRPFRGRKHKAGSKRTFYSAVVNYINNNVERLKEMETIKLISWVGSLIGWPVVGIAALLNIGTWKGHLLFGAAFLYLVARLFFFCIKQYQEYKLRQLRIKERNFEVNEKTNEDENE